MNNLYNIDLTRMLPPGLKEDKNMLAIADAIQGELLETIRMARLTLVYARIDELPEGVLDILAYDLHVDWYDYSYPLEVKREIIKSSTKVHKRLGTKFAVETALGALHPNSSIEEWFQYGGEPFTFRVILDTTHSRVFADPLEIRKTIDMYKRMTAHMDDMIYQCSIGLEIKIKTDKHKYKTKLAGRTAAGTYPHREVVGGAENIELELDNQVEAHKFNSRLAGTTPRRSRMAALANKEIELEPEIEGFGFRSMAAGRGKAGEKPQRNIETGLKSKQIVPKVTVTGYKYSYKFCGTIVARNK